MSGSQQSSNLEADEPADLRVFEACTDLLSGCDEGAVRGVREAVKRLWNSIISFIGDENLSQDFLDFIVDTIFGSMDFERVGDEENDNAMSDGEEDDGSISSAVEQTSESNDLEECEEEILLGEDALFDVLEAENSEEECEQQLLHTQEADDALAKMLHSRQEIRKRGQLQLLSQQILFKSRVLDVFEV